MICIFSDKINKRSCSSLLQWNWPQISSQGWQRRDANLQQFLSLFLIMLICNNVWNMFTDSVSTLTWSVWCCMRSENTLKLLWLIQLNDDRINYHFVKKVLLYFHISDCQSIHFESFCITVFIVIGKTSENHDDIINLNTFFVTCLFILLNNCRSCDLDVALSHSVIIVRLIFHKFFMSSSQNNKTIFCS